MNVIISFFLSQLDSSQAAHQTGCFTGNSTVLTSTGDTRLLSELKIGEKVLSMDNSGNTVFSEVYMFLDRNEDQTREFVKIETDGGASITATPSHLIYVWHTTSSTLNANYKFAGNVQIDDFVLVNVNGTLEPHRVLRIENELHRGVYAPLTYDGTIIVNSISASCYALVDTHSLAHMSLMPMRVYYSIKFFFNGSTIDNTLPRGIHWYANALNKYKNLFLPSNWFYRA